VKTQVWAVVALIAAVTIGLMGFTAGRMSAPREIIQIEAPQVTQAASTTESEPEFDPNIQTDPEKAKMLTDEAGRSLWLSLTKQERIDLCSLYAVTKWRQQPKAREMAFGYYDYVNEQGRVYDRERSLTRMFKLYDAKDHEEFQKQQEWANRPGRRDP
jgi:hypothetical protein